LSALWTTHRNRRAHQQLGGLEAITTTKWSSGWLSGKSAKENLVFTMCTWYGTKL
jgi:hypothetical protein